MSFSIKNTDIYKNISASELLSNPLSDNISSPVGNIISWNGNSFSYSDKIVITDGVEITGDLNITGNITSNNIVDTECLIITLTSGEAFIVGSVLSIDNTGRVVKHTLDYQIPVIGVAKTASTAAGDAVEVCISGVFNAAVKDDVTINAGQVVTIDDTGGELGRVITTNGTTGDSGTFGVATTTVTGNTAGTILVTGLFQKNEFV